MPRTRLQAQQVQLRKQRTRAALATHKELPRLSVHRSLRGMYAQIIDDTTGTTLAAVSDRSLKASGTKTEKATLVGEAIGKLAIEKKIKTVRFDRGAFRYHGRVAAVADGARKAGLKF